MKKKYLFLISYGIFLLTFTGCGADTGAADALTGSSVPESSVSEESESSVPDFSVESTSESALEPASVSTSSETQPVSSDDNESSSSEISQEEQEPAAETLPSPDPTEAPAPVATRDNTPYVPMPDAPGTVTYGNDVTTIDASNSSDGYIMARYTGSCGKVKMIITGPGSYKCTYDLNTADFKAFPLTAGNGSYSIGIYENIEGTNYATCYTTDIDVTISDAFSPYLRPSQYVAYDANTTAVSLAADLCATATDDLECVAMVYNYIIDNISYDYDKASQATSGFLAGYIADIDGTLASGKGICLDYAAVMTCMLRTQGIPTRLEVGYASNAYHAWISTYIKDVGWVNGVVEFDGKNWSLMDPTFGASSGEEDLRDFIGDGSNYTVRYIY